VVAIITQEESEIDPSRPILAIGHDNPGSIRSETVANELLHLAVVGLGLIDGHLNLLVQLNLVAQWVATSVVPVFDLVPSRVHNRWKFLGIKVSLSAQNQPPRGA
jgi:hypothetical protein